MPIDRRLDPPDRAAVGDDEDAAGRVALGDRAQRAQASARGGPPSTRRRTRSRRRSIGGEPLPRAPVLLAQAGLEDDRQAEPPGDDLGGLARAGEVARVDGVDPVAGEVLGERAPPAAARSRSAACRYAPGGALRRSSRSRRGERAAAWSPLARLASRGSPPPRHGLPRHRLDRRHRPRDRPAARGRGRAGRHHRTAERGARRRRGAARRRRPRGAGRAGARRPRGGAAARPRRLPRQQRRRRVPAHASRR